MAQYASFQDILFVLAGLAWIAYSAYRGNKKKEKSKPVDQHSSDNNAKGLFDEVMDMFDVQDTQVQEAAAEKSTAAATSTVNMESNINSATPFSYENVVEKEQHYNEIADELKTQNQFGREEETGSDLWSPKEEKRDSFNLKRAFIYSEILNNKYI